MTETQSPKRTAERRKAAVKLLRQNMSQAEVARVLGVSREAVRKWAARYQAGGLKALEPGTGKRGPKSDLSEDQLRALMNEAAAQGEGDSLAAILRIAHSSFLRSTISRSALRRRLVEIGLWK
jgi:transposase